MAATSRLTPETVLAATRAAVPAGPLVVALGGGADSAVAAWAVADLPDVRAIFVRHDLTGSPLLEESARTVAGTLSMPLTVVNAPVPAGPSVEERARTARWRAIGAAVADGETVVTGHTGDDQAETVLMNLLRGAGGAGIAGMERSRPGVARPLLRFGRADIRSLARNLALPFTDDPSNSDPAHLRNRIRASLLPLLERDYRPGIRTVLARTGTLSADDERLIEGLASRIPVHTDAGAVLIPTAPLTTVPVPVAARVIRAALRRLLAPYAGTAADVDTVRAVAAGRTRSATISRGLLVTREGPFVAIDPGGAVSGEATDVGVPSLVRFGDHEIRFAFDDGRPIRRRTAQVVDASVITSGAVLRHADTGERISIGSGTKTVRTVLSEGGVPVRKRPTWPVVASDGRIAVVVGLRVAPWARPATGRSVVITNERGHL